MSAIEELDFFYTGGIKNWDQVTHVEENMSGFVKICRLSREKMIVLENYKSGKIRCRLSEKDGGVGGCVSVGKCVCVYIYIYHIACHVSLHYIQSDVPTHYGAQ